VSGVAPGAVVTGEHTSGLLQIVSAEERVSKAVVVYACDELMQGDFLASFEPEPVRQPDPVAGTPEFGDAARILFADVGQMLGVPRRLMVIDRGSSNGLRVGQRLTLFRPRRRGVGDARFSETRSSWRSAPTRRRFAWNCDRHHHVWRLGGASALRQAPLEANRISSVR
jgi:hypothetical protein